MHGDQNCCGWWQLALFTARLIEIYGDLGTLAAAYDGVQRRLATLSWQRSVLRDTQLKPTVHYAIWSASTCWRTGFGQVRWCLRQAGDFFGLKNLSRTAIDSAITTCRDSASRFATGSLCSRRASQMDFKKRPDVRTCSTLRYVPNV